MNDMTKNIAFQRKYLYKKRYSEKGKTEKTTEVVAFKQYIYFMFYY